MKEEKITHFFFNPFPQFRFPQNENFGPSASKFDTYSTNQWEKPSYIWIRLFTILHSSSSRAVLFLYISQLTAFSKKGKGHHSSPGKRQLLTLESKSSGEKSGRSDAIRSERWVTFMQLYSHSYLLNSKSRRPVYLVSHSAISIFRMW